MPYILMFNAILQSEGIDPANVRLVRYEDTSYPGRSPYDLWKVGDGRFELYQSLQHGDVNFDVGDLLATFVATPAGETLFVGLCSVQGKQKAPSRTVCPIRLSEDGMEEAMLFDIHPDDRFARYTGLLVVDWGEGYRSWIQRADHQDKRVLEIRNALVDPFPGVRKFRCEASEIEAIPFGWREPLRSVNGIYLLVCMETGRQYVGSAYGQDGLWGRLVECARTDHGSNNIELRRHGSAHYQFSILEVVPQTVSLEELVRIESDWKDKLGSRKFGLNES